MSRVSKKNSTCSLLCVNARFHFYIFMFMWKLACIGARKLEGGPLEDKKEDWREKGIESNKGHML